MDFDAELDLDQLLDEEMTMRQDFDVPNGQPNQQPAKAVQMEHDDDELEAFLLAEEEHAASQMPQTSSATRVARPPSPPADFFSDEISLPTNLVPTSSHASSSASDLLESNGLLGGSSLPSSQHSIPSSARKGQNEPFPTSAQPLRQSSRAIEALSAFDSDTAVTSPSASEATAQAGPSRFATRAQPPGIPKYIPAGFVNATTMDGKPIRFERRKRMKGWKPPAIMADVDASQLLERPIHHLLDAVEALKALDVVEKAETERTQARSAAKQSAADGPAPASRMWVDKHRPNKFTELLGDERVHREVLGWLKEWDECVFKRKNHRKERHRQYIHQVWASREQLWRQGGDHVWKDPYGRPKERIMMISGPPGLGKTTLAHVIGAHAGYNVYELNASDARSAGAVEDVIKMALESGSLKDPRPTLVVIDEIDGATGGGGGATGESHGFVRALVRLVEMGKGAGPKAAGLAARGKKQQRKGTSRSCDPSSVSATTSTHLRYAPYVPWPSWFASTSRRPNLVVKRLREVCEVESLAVEARGLSLLAELTNGDIRSCLNALEFAKTKNIALTEAAVKNASIGIKDTGGTVHKAWEMLFRRQNRKQAAASSMKGANAHAKDADGSPWNATRKASAQELTSDGKEKQKDFALVDTPQENVSRIVHEVISCNEYDKLAQGCFEHYPTLRAADGGWKRYRQVHDWLHFGQAISTRAWSHGNYELLGFMPWSFVPWHLLFAHIGNALPEYPKVDYENYLKTSAFNEIATQIVTTLPATVRSQFNRQSVITELGPSLMRILTPELRPINNQLSRAEDKQYLARWCRS